MDAGCLFCESNKVCVNENENEHLIKKFNVPSPELNNSIIGTLHMFVQIESRSEKDKKLIQSLILQYTNTILQERYITVDAVDLSMGVAREGLWSLLP